MHHFYLNSEANVWDSFEAGEALEQGLDEDVENITGVNLTTELGKHFPIVLSCGNIFWNTKLIIAQSRV